MALTKRQKAFCEEYVKSYNATKAYLKVNDCTYETANSTGCLLLKKPEVLEYIKLLQAEHVKRFGDLSQLIINELVEDIYSRDDDGKHNSGWQKSVDLLQKQLGLQNQKVDISGKPQIEITISGEENGDKA